MVAVTGLVFQLSSPSDISMSSSPADSCERSVSSMIGLYWWWSIGVEESWTAVGGCACNWESCSCGLLVGCGDTSGAMEDMFHALRLLLWLFIAEIP